MKSWINFLLILVFLVGCSVANISRYIAGDSKPSKAYFLDTGEKSLQARLDLIRDPEVTHINFSTFVFEKKDEVGIAHLKAFIDAARAGKRVNILFDGMNLEGFGSTPITKEVIHLLQQAGVNVYIYRNTKTLRHMPLKYKRMHDKLMMFKKKGKPEYLITGGRNTKNRYFQFDEPEINNREYETLVKGDAVDEAFDYFEERLNSKQVDHHPTVTPWEVDHDELSKLRAKIDNGYDTITNKWKVYDPQGWNWESKLFEVEDLKFINNGGNPNLKTGIMRHFLDLLKGAEDNVIADAQYFLPTKAMVKELLAATNRNAPDGDKVKVQITTNGVGAGLYEDDWKTTDLFDIEKDRWKKFGEGFNLKEHVGKGKIHSKVVVRDGKECLIWSANLDPRSQVLNLEVGVRVLSETFCKQVEEEIREKTKHCTICLPQRQKDESPPRKVSWNDEIPST